MTSRPLSARDLLMKVALVVAESALADAQSIAPTTYGANALTVIRAAIRAADPQHSHDRNI